MLKKIKLKQNFNSLFLTFLFEKDTFFFFENIHLIKNSQYIFCTNMDIIKILIFVLEFKPVQLNDMVSYDSYFLEKIDYCIYKPVTTFYHMFSYKLNSYKYFFFECDVYSSIYNFYKNAVWLEREQLEFFGVIFTNMYDCRNLMLEYDYDINIFLKEYGLTGENNFYSTFYNKIEHIANIYNTI